MLGSGMVLISLQIRECFGDLESGSGILLGLLAGINGAVNVRSTSIHSIVWLPSGPRPVRAHCRFPQKALLRACHHQRAPLQRAALHAGLSPPAGAPASRARVSLEWGGSFRIWMSAFSSKFSGPSGPLVVGGSYANSKRTAGPGHFGTGAFLPSAARKKGGFGFAGVWRRFAKSPAPSVLEFRFLGARGAASSVCCFLPQASLFNTCSMLSDTKLQIIPTKHNNMRLRCRRHQKYGKMCQSVRKIEVGTRGAESETKYLKCHLAPKEPEMLTNGT
eukprot:gene13793-biopygen11098